MSGRPLVVRTSSFRNKSSQQRLLKQFFSNSASETILLNNSSSASEVDVPWSAARQNELEPPCRSLFILVKTREDREDPTSGYFANLSMLKGCPGCPTYLCLSGVLSL